MGPQLPWHGESTEWTRGVWQETNGRHELPKYGIPIAGEGGTTNIAEPPTMTQVESGGKQYDPC